MKTAFLDRDGVINRKRAEGQYVTCWEEFELLSGSVEAVHLLNEAGFRVIVVSNQRGVARGLMTEERLREIHERMTAQMAAAGAGIDAVYYCPHEEGTCDCRKPSVGLFMRAREAFPDISFEESFVIGDSRRDVEAGRKLGARVILIGPPAAYDVLSASSLLDAVRRHVLVQ